MQKYTIVVAYDGTAYHGWQTQKEFVTVAGTLERVYEEVFHQSVTLYGASRTDAEVHSLGQVAHFSTDIKITPQDFLRAWQAHLPRDIVIRSLVPVADDFHARFNVRQKTYYYHFFTKRPLPLVARYGFYQRSEIDFEKLQTCLQIFVGEHDFRSFCTGDDYENTVRTIDSIQLIYDKKFQVYRIVVRGPGFLRYMIRRIVGASLHVACTPDLTPQLLRDVLAEKNPLQKLPTAPGHGLLLRRIVYL